MNEQQGGTGRIRLDECLVRRGFFASRSRARDAVARGTVLVSGVPITKPGTPVVENADIAVDDPARGYVSRAALKLKAGLAAFGVEAEGRTALDIGASTGGFTQVLLEAGARHVFAIDVGHGQFDASLGVDPRITVIEGLNARDLTHSHIGDQLPDLLVSDVSFISLTLALPPALDLAAPGAQGVFLVKPQFEAGRAAIGKGGLLRDADEAPRVAERLAAWLDSYVGWQARGLLPSPIGGGDGNREFLLHGEKVS